MSNHLHYDRVLKIKVNMEMKSFVILCYYTMKTERPCVSNIRPIIQSNIHVMANLLGTPGYFTICYQ